jgi:hypothetical protein
MDHVVIRKLEHIAGSSRAPQIEFAVEARDRPGPVHKRGAFPDEEVWIQVNGGLYVAKARIELCWLGEFSSIGEVRTRTRGAPIYEMADYWKGRPRFGYAAVASLKHEKWITPFWGGPRTYGYEWVLMDSDKKHATWLNKRDAPKGGSDLLQKFTARFARSGR